jgi:hypothetical protein
VAVEELRKTLQQWFERMGRRIACTGVQVRQVDLLKNRTISKGITLQLDPLLHNRVLPGILWVEVVGMVADLGWSGDAVWHEHTL